MIFGKTSSEKFLNNQKKFSKMIKGIKRFAWLPTVLKDGRLIWLQAYYRYYSGYKCLVKNDLYELRLVRKPNNIYAYDNYIDKSDKYIVCEILEPDDLIVYNLIVGEEI